MTKFFTSLYKFFENRKSLMYTILGALVVFSVYFGLKVQYEEDITKLLPSAATSDSGLAFGNLKVKDKIFIQITSPRHHPGHLYIVILCRRIRGLADGERFRVTLH